MSDFIQIDEDTGIVGPYPTVRAHREANRQMFARGYAYFIEVNRETRQGIYCKYLHQIGPIIREVMPNETPRIADVRQNGTMQWGRDAR